MRRLIDQLRTARSIHRANGERGAVAVITAVSLVALLGFAAIAIDVGMLYQERAELQSGADAAALAVAQDCSKDVNCTGPLAHPQAREMANGNATDSQANVAEPIITGNAVRVNVSTRESSGAGSLALSFAPVLGIDSADVGATALAKWGSPNAGTAVLPIVISPCDFDPALVDPTHFDPDLASPDFVSGPQVLQLHSITGTHKNTATGGCEYKNSSGANMPGGFGFIDPPEGQCSATVQLGAPSYSDPGNNLPGACIDVLQKHLGQTVLLPMYNNLGAQGNKGWYTIDGWVAFKLQGWNFPGSSAANTAATTTTGKTCESPCTGLIGEFVEFAGLDDAFFDPSLPPGPDHGVSIITLED